MITTINYPPEITFQLDPYLLDPLKGLKIKVEKKIIPYSKIKIRSQDIGKQREFNKLITEFYEEYERKKAEEEIYKTKIKNSSKRSNFPYTGRTCTFKRFQS